ncbi:MAG: hypothetical protein NTX17_05320 [Candidatus Eisenbacteria bacterium]|nr:hypothetical protein [Candidatus Eisenbacteria bacterium]
MNEPKQWQDDMRHFCRPNAFDAAVMMFTSFGFFKNPDENRQVDALAQDWWP